MVGSARSAIPFDNDREDYTRQKRADPITSNERTDQHSVEPEANGRRDLAHQHQREPGPVRDWNPTASAS